MRVRAGGYTEAETLALAWSKRSKDFDLIKAKLPYNTSSYDDGSREYGRRKLTSDSAPRSYKTTVQKSPDHNKGRAPPRTSPSPRKERNPFERDSPNYSPYEGNIDKFTVSGGIECTNSRHRNPTDKCHSCEWDRSCSRERSRGRACTRDETRTTRSSKGLKNSRRERHGSISRSRSRSSSKSHRRRHKEKSARPHRSRSRSRSFSRSRSRSKTSYRRSPLRSRSRSRSPLPPTWTHDKFAANTGSSPSPERRRELQNYRPPSPTWVSRAGGVAIMRKKTASASSNAS